MSKTAIVSIALILSLATCRAYAEDTKWRISAYCSCKICCGKYADGVTASGKRVREGFVANNWLNLGQVIEIKGLGEYIVEDRGSIKYFGAKAEKRKAIDVYFNTHQAAKDFGVQHREVVIK